MAADRPPVPLPRPHGGGPPNPGGDCTQLRTLLVRLQNELAQDVAHLTALRNGHAPAAEIAEWAQVVSLKSDEVASTRADMQASGCFDVPPRPPPALTLTDLGPAAIVDDDGKVLGNGAVVDVAAHPGNPAVLYAATAGGGVWRTTSAAIGAPAWETRTDLLPSTAMGSVAVAAGDPTGRTVLAGTGSYSSWGPTGLPVGLYKSVDAGDTWRVTGAATLAGRRIRVVLPLAPPNGTVVLVAAHTGSATGGVFRSADLGDTFGPAVDRTRPRDRLPNAEGWALVEDPIRPGRVYCAVGGSRPGIYRSDNAGRAWTRVTTGISASQLSTAVWIRMAIRPPGRKAGKFGASTLYAGIVDAAGNGGQLAGIYAADAGTDTWTAIPLPPGGGAAVHSRNQGTDKFAIAAHPTRPLLFVAGDIAGVWRADLTDQAAPVWDLLTSPAPTGPTPGNVPAGAPHADTQALVFDADRNLLVATDGGLYRANAPDRQPPGWQHLGETMHINEPLDIAYDTLAGVAIAGSADNGVAYQLAPASVRWRELAGSDGGGVAVDNTASDHSWRYYMTFTGGPGAFGVFRARFDAANHQQAGGGQLTLADPATPTVALSGIAPADRSANPYFAVNTSAPDRLLLGAGNVYESSDGGATITTLLAPGPGVGGPLVMVCGGRQDGAEQPDVAYIALGTRLWRRAPGGAGLTQLISYPGGVVNHLALDPYDRRRLIVLDATHVWRSTTSGDAWNDCTGNLATLAVGRDGTVSYARTQVVRAAATSVREAVLVGTATGLYRTLTATSGAAALWERIGNLPHAIVQDLKYAPPATTHRGGDVLLVGLQGRGTWKLDNAGSRL